MARDGSRTLIRAARPRVVATCLAQLWIPLAGALLVPIAVAVGLQAWGFAWRAGVVVALVGALSLRPARRSVPSDLYWNEALTVVILIFLTGALALAWPLTGFGLAPVDALFEAVSAITTTGLSTVDDVAANGPAFLFTRAWVQWYAGFLIVVVGLALVFPPGAVAKRFAQTGFDDNDVAGGTRARARHAVRIYCLLTAAGFALVLAGGAAPFDALLHVLTAVSTAGFSSHSDSIAALPWASQIALTVLSVAGALSFVLYQRLLTGDWRGALRDREFATLLGLCLLAAAVLTAVQLATATLPWQTVLRQAPLLAVSAQTTTGFEPLDPVALDGGSKLILAISMFVGGDVGSTAGGIKILRLLLIVGLLRLILLRTALPPHAVSGLRLAGRSVPPESLQAMVATVLLFLLLALGSWLVFLLAGVPALDGLFEVVSALATAGLSAGVAAPELAPGLKLLLCLDMLAGRVEVLALLTLLYPPTWLGRGG